MIENEVSLLTKHHEAFLQKYLHQLGISNYKVEVTSATSQGDNYLGIILRIKVNSGDLTFNWILKTALQQEKFRHILGLEQVYKRECYIYSTVLKIFDEFQIEKCVRSPFNSYPKYHTHLLDPPRECIIMDDLKYKGYVLEDRFKPLGYNQVMMVLREYGKLHALSFALRDQKPLIFEEIAKNTKDKFFSNPVMTSEESTEAANLKLNAIKDAIDKDFQKNIYMKFLEMERDFVAVGMKCVQPELAGKYNVVCHGDCWINNLLFQYSDPKNPQLPTNLAIIDWQLSRICSPVLDVSHFLYTNTDKQFRDVYYNEAIEEYYNSFSSFLEELGSDPKILFPNYVFQDHLKKYSIFGLYTAIQCLFLVFSLKDEIPDLQNMTSKKDGVEVLNYKPKHMEKYTTRIIEVIEHFDKLGYNLQV